MYLHIASHKKAASAPAGRTLILEEFMDRDEVIKKYIPSLLLFIVGFIAAFIYLGGYSFFDRIGTSFLAGWFGGGFLWGWSLTKKWFPNFRFSSNYQDSGNWGADGFRFAFHIMGVVFRMVIALIVGGIAMPVGIIMIIIAAVNAAKEAKERALEAESADNSQGNTDTQ
jgi:uncharacterized membrane protein